MIQTSSVTHRLLRTQQSIRTGLTGVIRWSKFLDRLPIRKENCLEHTFDTVLLAIMVAEAMKSSSKKFDAYGLVCCAVLHDIGEAKTGDIAYGDRRQEHADAEAHAFLGFFEWAPPQIRDGLRDAYALQGSDVAITVGSVNPDANTVLLFEFVERYGYLLFALEQYAANSLNLPLVEHVVKNQLLRIKELLRMFPELEMFLTKEDLEELGGQHGTRGSA